jgi:hypothetical protein
LSNYHHAVIGYENMMIRKIPLGLFLLPLALVAQFGCQQAPQQATPDRARTILREALDAWQQGQTPEAFRQRTSITAVERKWREGCRLVRYEIVGDGERFGFDWQCKTKLSLENATGKKLQEKAIYSISTAPALVVVRSEGM